MTDWTTVRLPASHAVELKRLAAAHQHSLAAELRVAVAAHVQREAASMGTSPGSGNSTGKATPPIDPIRLDEVVLRGPELAAFARMIQPIVRSPAA